MKKSTILMIVILMTGYITVTAQTEPQYKPSIDQLYLTVEEVPNAVYWLPAPPEPGTTQFVHDINQYYWGKEQRLDSARASKPKATYGRLRPYVRFNEPTLFPGDEEELRDQGSYPSGHTVRGWGMALLLCEINPDAQNELFKLGYEWGQSRVIAGYHWQSDVDASRMLAAACYARLHACEEFLKDMAEARKEFKKQSR